MSGGDDTPNAECALLSRIAFAKVRGSRMAMITSSLLGFNPVQPPERGMLLLSGRQMCGRRGKDADEAVAIKAVYSFPVGVALTLCESDGCSC